MNIEIKTSVHLPEIEGLAKSIQREVQRAVARTAFKIESDAKLKAPVDTGALRASILTSGGAVKRLEGIRNLTGQVADTALKHTRRLRAPLQIEPPRDPYSAIIAPHMHYSIYQERKRRYMQGAYLANRGMLQSEVKRAIEAGKK